MTVSAIATPHIFADLTLARRLERAEARGCADFVEARARITPDSGAAWTEVAGTCAMFDGIDSPITQTFGLGVFEEATPAHLDALESFFLERGAAVYHEVSPLADPALLSLLNQRHYQPIEFTSVMYRPIAPDNLPLLSLNDALHTRLTASDEGDLWAQTAARGWLEFKELAPVIEDLMRVIAARSDALLFLTEQNGAPIAAGALGICAGVALLAGASTIPEARRQGAQSALLDCRLRYAVANGCDLAMICALPGSASQRNAERQGFRIAYTRTKWRLNAGQSGNRADGQPGTTTDPDRPRAPPPSA
jgi:hypothetical protein